MKTLIAINGSPRRNGNTAQLLQQALSGAQSAGASTEMIHLYALNQWKDVSEIIRMAGLASR